MNFKLNAKQIETELVHRNHCSKTGFHDPEINRKNKYKSCMVPRSETSERERESPGKMKSSSSNRVNNGINYSTLSCNLAKTVRSLLA